jgi:hypothetical protein
MEPPVAVELAVGGGGRVWRVAPSISALPARLPTSGLTTVVFRAVLDPLVTGGRTAPSGRGEATANLRRGEERI